MRIEKKVWPEYFQKIIDGVKTYELRLADFECKPGNISVLKVSLFLRKRKFIGEV